MKRGWIRVLLCVGLLVRSYGFPTIAEEEPESETETVPEEHEIAETESPEPVKEEVDELPATTGDEILPEEEPADSVTFSEEIIENEVLMDEDPDTWLEEKRNSILSEIITEGMSDYDKLVAIASYLTSHYDYGSASSEYTLYKDGSGSCFANSTAVLNLANKLGIETVYQDARYENPGSNHRNVISKTSDGKYYEVEAGTSGTAPRSYWVHELPLFISGTATIDGVKGTSFLRALYFDLETVVVPETYNDLPVIKLGDSSTSSYWRVPFTQLENLKEVYLPKTMMLIGDAALTGSYKVYIDEENPYYSSDGDCVYSKDQSVLYRFIKGKEELITPAGVETINSSSVGWNYDLKRVVLNEGLKTIGSMAFYNDNNIKSVLIPSTVTSIGDYGFGAIMGNHEITILSNDAVIGSKAFSSYATIVGLKGSTAETYANENSIPFVDIETIEVTGVELDQSAIALEKNEIKQLSATISPANVYNKTIVWSSSNTSVATVDETGMVTGIGEGTAIITATTQNGNKTATCRINIGNVTDITVSVKSLGDAVPLAALYASDTSDDEIKADMATGGTLALVKSSGATVKDGIFNCGLSGITYGSYKLAAYKNGYLAAVLPVSITVETETENISLRALGDATNDGSVDVSDIILIRDIILGESKAGERTETDTYLSTAADVNKDSRIDVSDIILVRDRILGVVDENYEKKS